MCLEKSEIGLIELVGDEQNSKHNCNNVRKIVGGSGSRKISERRGGVIQADMKS